MKQFLSLLLLFLSCFNNVALVLTFLPFLQLQGTVHAHDIPDTDTTATFDDYQHHHHSDGSIVLGNHLQDQLATPAVAGTSPKLGKSHHLRIQNQFIQTETKTTLNCPNGLQDGNYIFRSSSEEDWSFCGVSGTGSHEFHFQIRDCECFAGISGGRVCDFAAPSPSSSVESIFKSSSVALGGSSITTIATLDNLSCSHDDYSISSTDTCLLITLSDQFGDGWTSGDGSTENAWFGYSFSSVTSSNDDFPSSSAITYHSLTCSCPRQIGCISPASSSSSSSLPSGDQLINLAIYSNRADDGEEEIPVAFSWEIMYLVQVIQNGRLMDSYYGGYRTQMEFSYTHSSGTLTLSSKTDGPVGNGDAVDVSGCEDPVVVELVSELPLSLKGWSIVDINNKHEPYSARNPLCFHTQSALFSSIPSPVLSIDPVAPPSFFLDQDEKDSWPFPHAQDIFSDVPISSSRHLSGELQFVGNVSTLAGVAGSSGTTDGMGTNSKFIGPTGVSISSDGLFVLVADRDSHLIRHIILSTASVSTLAGVAGSAGATNGIGTNSQFNNPRGVSISPDGLFALVAEWNNFLIRHIILSTATVSTLAGVVGSAGATNGIGTNSQFSHLHGISISPDGHFALVADWNNHLIRHIILSTASVSTLAGVAGSAGATNGMGTNSQFINPRGVSISPDGLFALVADSGNNLIRHIILSTASVSTLAGVAGSAGATNGIGTNSQFNCPTGVSISPDGLFALVADQNNHLIPQIILSTASVSTLAGVAGSAGATNGIGTNSKFNWPYGVSISPDGLFALVADLSNHLIRQIFLSTASASPSSLPSDSPSISFTSPTRLSFGVKIGAVGMLSSGKAILVDYLQDKRRGLPYHLPPASSSFFFLFQGRCFPSLASSTPLGSPPLPTLPCPLNPFSSSGVPCQQCRGSDLGNPTATRSSAFLPEECWCRGS
jgi:hypothetical protein